jgi:hypothetical protein
MLRSTLLALALPLTAWAGVNDLNPIELRGQGPDGLATVLDAWHAEGSPDTNEWHTLADSVGQQRDALTSGLYWYTDLEQAKSQSESTDKPILSLRLLGDLTQEYSCANSRFFRTVLYSDPEIASWLSETFVLHWSSERPAPLLTIDYGDGRVVQRTITGNSAHYVLDETGRPLDVLPGLVSPASFQQTLAASAALWSSMHDDSEQAEAVLAAYHRDGVTQAAERLSNDLSHVRGEAVDADILRDWLTAITTPDGAVHALEPMNLAITKMIVEEPILSQFMGRDVRRTRGGPLNPMDQTFTDLLPSNQEWAALGDARMADITLSEGAIQRIRDENPHLNGDVGELVASLTQSIARDTLLNERLLRPRIQARFADTWNVFPADRVNTASFQDLNAWVYASVFLTPREDAWLGMVDEAVYTGLDDGGVRREGPALEDLASN